MEIPIEEPLGYAGVALLLAGFFLVLAGLGIVRIEKISVSRGGKTCVLGFILAAFGIALLVPSISDAFAPSTPTIAPTLIPIDTSAPTLIPIDTSTPTQAPADTPISMPTYTPMPIVSPTPTVSLEQSVRDYYSFIEQKQYTLAWAMSYEFEVGGKPLPFDVYVSEWEKSGPATVVDPIDVVENYNEATITLTLYYPKKDVYHRFRYELVHDIERGNQRFGYWLFVKGSMLY